MAELRQSAEERAELNAIWEAHPKVKQFKADLNAFVAQEGLEFDVAGMNASSAFSQQWHKDNGALPDSGILTG